MNIDIPRRLDLENSLEFCRCLSNVINDKEYIYDYRNTSNAEPFGMLLTASKIKKFVSEHSNSNHKCSNFERLTYLAHMGYFKSFNLDFGKKPGEAPGSDTYIPITEIKIKESYVDAFYKDINIQKYIQIIASDLSKILSRSNDYLKQILTYCITEIIRNVYDHSKSRSLWYAAQYWPTKGLVEVAIIDEGMGIKKSFAVKNKQYEIESDLDAIKFSVLPGITRTTNKKDPYDIFSNSGYGLFMTRNICKKYGDFAICSGKKCCIFSGNNYKIIDTNFDGTIIRIRINTTFIDKSDINLDNSLSSLRTEGAQIEKDITKNKFKTIGILNDYL